MHKVKSFTNASDTSATAEWLFDDFSGAVAHVAMQAENAEHDMNADLAPEFMRHVITRGFSNVVLEHTVDFFCSFEQRGSRGLK